MSELLMPPYPNGSVQQQLTQQYSYLFQMAQQLNMALSALEGGAVSTAGNSGQQRKSGGAASAARESGAGERGAVPEPAGHDRQDRQAGVPEHGAAGDTAQ